MVPGIGPSTAQKILQTRKSYGAFKDVNDLLAIRGIGEKRLDKMRKYLTVAKPAAPKTGLHATGAAPAAKTSRPPQRKNAGGPKKAPESATPATKKKPTPADEREEEEP